MWKGWKISESQKFFSNIIQQVKELQENNRKDGKIKFQFNQNLTIIFYNNTLMSKYSTSGAGTGSKMT
jgi:hypothetical protein